MTVARSGAIVMAAMLGVTGLLVSPAAAELPPQYTVWADFGAVAGNTSIPQLLGVVDSIERAPDGTYIVRSGTCSVTATVVRASARSFPSGRVMPGPSHIVRVELGPKHCKQGRPNSRTP
jgi:hypothetical protein